MEVQVATDPGRTTVPSLREAAQQPIMIVVDQSEAQAGAGEEEGAGQEGEEEAEQGVVLMTLEHSGEEGYMALKAPKATYLAFSIALFISLKQLPVLSFSYVPGISFLCALAF